MAELRESASAEAPAKAPAESPELALRAARPESSAGGGAEERKVGDREDDPARAVVTGVPILDLFSTEHLRGEAGVAVSVEAADLLSAELVALVLTPSDPVPERAYHLRILDPRGGEAWGGPATADPSGAVVLSLPSALLSPGRWSFVLVPSRDDELARRVESAEADRGEKLVLELRRP